MKQRLVVGAASLCVLVVLTAWPSPGAAGGGYGYHGGFRHHFGFRHHGYGHHGPWPFRRFGHYGHGPYHGHGHRFRPRGYYESPWDDDPPVYSEPRVYEEPEISSEPLPPVSASETCRQVREYQTQIYVGGKPVQAYGRACLQPDGSWSYEVPRVVAD